MAKINIIVKPFRHSQIFAKNTLNKVYVTHFGNVIYWLGDQQLSRKLETHRISFTTTSFSGNKKNVENTVVKQFNAVHSSKLPHLDLPIGLQYALVYLGFQNCPSIFSPSKLP